MQFDDFTILPSPVSYVRSRNDVNTNFSLCGATLSVPLLSSNMTSVYSPTLDRIIEEFGGKSVVHRFCSIEENIKLFQDGCVSNRKPWVSVGVSEQEFERAKALHKVGAEVFVLEVANASHISCIEQYRRLRSEFPDVSLVVGTFAVKEQVEAFITLSGSKPDAILVGIGSGAACTTGTDVTGIHIPITTTIRSTAQCGIPVIVSGGISKPADMMKALAMGAKAVMCGKLFSACYESGAKGFSKDGDQFYKDYSDKPQYKWYYGSASPDAYKEQSKESTFRPVEGKGIMVKTSGSTLDLLTYYQASLRSTMSYVDAHSVDEFHAKVKWGIKSKL
jgi:IMP dehydrogenase/GMP reductase